MEHFAQYGHAIVSLAVISMIAMVLSPLSAVLKMGEGGPSGASAQSDYASRTYRVNRAYLNLTENIGVFACVVLAAVLAGADPTWVNWCASIFLVARILHLLVHVLNIGPMNFGPRTILYTISVAAKFVLALLAVFAVL